MFCNSVNNMSRLTKLLEFGFAGPAEQSRILNKESFKTIVGKDTHALLQSERTAVADSTLVQEEVYKTVLEGTEPVKCIRDIIPIINTNSYSVRFVKGEAGTYANKIAEGAKIEIDTQEYSKQDITIDKYGVRPLITNELIEDALFDVVELELKKAGARMENALNRQALYQILVGSNKINTSTLNPGGPHIAISDIARAVALVKKQDYMPDCLLLHPTAEGYLLQDSNLAYVSYSGGPGALRQGDVGNTIMGLKPFYTSATDAASPVWDDTTAGSDVTGIVFSKQDLATICMRRDLTIEQYEDPIHDLVGMALTMRFGTDVLHEKAGCIIYHK